MTQQKETGEPLAESARTTIGFVLSHEQFPAPQLLELGVQGRAGGLGCRVDQ